VTGNFAGTYDFMPREQLINFKRVAPTSDVWAMAATFYFLATSTLPRDASPNQDPIGAVLAAPLVPFRVRCAHAPMALADVIDAALSDDVSRRPQDAAAFAAQLRSIPLI
jgi:serine/threonine protein kinase